MVEIFTAPIARTTRGEQRNAEREAVASLVNQRFGSNVTLAHTPDGAPYIPGFGGHISVSHCADECVLAVSSEPVGVDVDTPRPQLMRVARRFLNLRELADIDLHGEMTDDARIDLLLRYWTAKEAVFKCAAIPSLVISEIEIGLRVENPLPLEAVASARGCSFAVSYTELPGGSLRAVATKRQL